MPGSPPLPAGDAGITSRPCHTAFRRKFPASDVHLTTNRSRTHRRPFPSPLKKNWGTPRPASPVPISRPRAEPMIGIATLLNQHPSRNFSGTAIRDILPSACSPHLYRHRHQRGSMNAASIATIAGRPVPRSVPHPGVEIIGREHRTSARQAKRNRSSAGIPPSGRSVVRASAVHLRMSPKFS